jgi:cathepsin L
MATPATLSNNIKASEGYSFELYVQEFLKVYSSDEEYQYRNAIFDSNLKTILAHNRYGESNYFMDLNEFTDLLNEELPTGYDKSFHPAWSSETAFLSAEKRWLVSENTQKNSPIAVDWRSHGGITTAVKNQGHCGSCWAFASTAALESHIAIETGKLFTLSVQELVSWYVYTTSIPILYILF